MYFYSIILNKINLPVIFFSDCLPADALPERILHPNFNKQKKKRVRESSLREINTIES